MIRLLLLAAILIIPLLTRSQSGAALCSHSRTVSAHSAQTTDGRLDMKYLLLELSADNQSTRIAGTASLLVKIKEAHSEIHLELVDELTVTNVSVNSQIADYQHTNGQLIVRPARSYQPGDLITIRVTYNGTPNPASDGILSGINSAVSNAWDNRITWTLSQPFNAKSWWPARQDLNDKIDSVRIHITTDRHLKVGANGLLINTVNLARDRVRYEWKSNYPIAYYLVAFTVGEYVEYNQYAKPEALNGESILIQNYIYNNEETLPYYQTDLDMVPEMLEIFSDLFGLYPFHKEKYGHMMAPFSGGMEHQTMSSMGIFTFGLDAHELGHQWFGNKVTCATWNDIWINEGFARFTEYAAAEKMLGFDRSKAIMTDDMLSVTGTNTGSVYIPKDQKLTDDRIFQYRLTYLKGGLIINMIRRLVKNDDLFFQTLRTYLKEFADSTATGEDFKKVLERETKMDFDSFFDQWYYGGGFPVFDISWTKLPGDSIEINVHQTTTDDVPLFTTPLEFEITFESGLKKKFHLYQTQAEQSFTVRASGKVEKLQFDKDNWLIKKVDRFVQLDENGNPILSASQPSNISLYPNPVHDVLNLSRPVSTIHILDATGRSIYSVQPGRQNQQLNVSRLQPGLYYLRAETPTETYSLKFFKQ